MAIKIKKHKIPFDTWSPEEWGLFYKEFLLCKKRRDDGEPFDEDMYNIGLTDMYFRYPNFSYWSRETGIPRTSIAHAVNKTIDKFTHSSSNI